MRLLRVCVLVSLLIVGAGCASPVPAPPQAPPAAAPAAPTTSAEASMLAFGAAHTWPNGDSITVANPRTLPGAGVSDPRYKRVIAVDVTVTNAGSAPVVAESYTTYADTDGDNATEIAVSGVNRPNGFIAPGGKQHWTVAWQIVPTAPVQLTVQAFGAGGDPNRPPVFFGGKV